MVFLSKQLPHESQLILKWKLACVNANLFVPLVFLRPPGFPQISLGPGLVSAGLPVLLPLTDPSLTCVWAPGLLVATVWACVCVCTYV